MNEVQLAFWAIVVFGGYALRQYLSNEDYYDDAFDEIFFKREKKK